MLAQEELKQPELQAEAQQPRTRPEPEVPSTGAQEADEADPLSGSQPPAALAPETPPADAAMLAQEAPPCETAALASTSSAELEAADQSEPAAPAQSLPPPTAPVAEDSDAGLPPPQTHEGAGAEIAASSGRVAGWQFSCGLASSLCFKSRLRITTAAYTNHESKDEPVLVHALNRTADAGAPS